MAENHEKLDALLKKLEALMEKQEAFSKEVKALQNEIHHLKGSNPIPAENQRTTPTPSAQSPKTPLRPFRQAKKATADMDWDLPPKPKKSKTDFEKFIGENLANKIGIIIVVIGVAIGAKYTIDNQLIEIGRAHV